MKLPQDGELNQFCLLKFLALDKKKTLLLKDKCLIDLLNRGCVSYEHVPRIHLPAISILHRPDYYLSILQIFQSKLREQMR